MADINKIVDDNGNDYNFRDSDAARNTPTFSQASSRENLNGSGETMPIILGKTKKWFTDLKALAFKDNVSDGDINDTISDAHIASASTWNAKQNALSSQTAYSAKGSATKVPKITTNSVGQVTKIEEVTISGVAPSAHLHGNIQNDGTLQSSDISIANGDKLVVTDSSNSNKIARTSISFDGSTTTQGLSKKGTWQTFLTSHQTVTITTGTNDGTLKLTTAAGTTDNIAVFKRYSADNTSTSPNYVKLSGDISFSNWSNLHEILTIKSRRQGNGILSISITNNNSAAMTTSTISTAVILSGSDIYFTKPIKIWVKVNSASSATARIFVVRAENEAFTLMHLAGDSLINQATTITAEEYASQTSGFSEYATEVMTRASSAAKLTTARTTYVTLGTASTSTTRDWSGTTTIPVDGVLNVINGGTGSNSPSTALSNLGGLAKSGGTMTGALNLASNKYYGSNNEYGLDCKNSDIINLNSIYTADKADDGTEGIRFKGNQSTPLWDTFTADGSGKFYLMPTTQKNSAPFPSLSSGYSSAEMIIFHGDASKDVGYLVCQGGTAKASLLAGSGNSNHGVYDDWSGKWMIKTSGNTGGKNNVVCIGDESDTQVRLGKYILDFSGTVGSATNTIYFT